MEQTQSLFDYMKRAAGPHLGLEVAKYARQLKEPVLKEMVDEPYYKGLVNVYRIPILEKFFNDPANAKLIQDNANQYEIEQAKKRGQGGAK